MLQAFFDDSRTGNANSSGGMFVLAGYIATVPEWLKFNRDWQRVLDMPPSWGAFKMSQAKHHYGSLLPERMNQFHEVIENNIRAAVKASVDLDDHYKLFGYPSEKTKRLRHPYYMLLIDLVIQIKRVLSHPSLDLPNDIIEFIFDEQMTEKEHIRYVWKSIGLTRPDIAAHLGNEPNWGKEEEYLPLQAADKLAWWTRKHLEDGKAGRTLTPILWTEKRTIPTIGLHLDAEQLERILVGKN